MRPGPSVLVGRPPFRPPESVLDEVDHRVGQQILVTSQLPTQVAGYPSAIVSPAAAAFGTDS